MRSVGHPLSYGTHAPPGWAGCFACGRKRIRHATQRVRERTCVGVVLGDYALLLHRSDARIYTILYKARENPVPSAPRRSPPVIQATSRKLGVHQLSITVLCSYVMRTFMRIMIYLLLARARQIVKYATRSHTHTHTHTCHNTHTHTSYSTHPQPQIPALARHTTGPTKNCHHPF